MTTPSLLQKVDDESNRPSALGASAWGRFGFDRPILEGLSAGEEDPYETFCARVVG